MRVQEENERKRQAFTKAIELLRNKPEDDTTDPSTYIREKLNIPEEWADEFVNAYNEILKKEIQAETDNIAQSSEEQTQDYQISDEDHLTEPQVEENPEIQISPEA